MAHRLGEWVFKSNTLFHYLVAYKQKKISTYKGSFKNGVFNSFW